MQINKYTLDAPYLGLINIGATCYMNSVLQTLFMTPEFRRGIYLWNYEKDKHGQEKDSIPFQLQKLFSRLQTKIFDYIDTRDLTKSFQWDVHQAFEQHDIQEFMRVLFDAIEQSDCKFAKELFEGIQANFTKCLNCGYESLRQQEFMDYGVIIKDQFSRIYNDNLNLALQLSLKPETLNGKNQYFCDTCQCKQDALRGQIIQRLPHIFTVHLTRFTFDYTFMRREKISDGFKFPFVLNMNDYINGYDGIKNKLEEKLQPQEEKPKFGPTPFKPPTYAPPPPPKRIVPKTAQQLPSQKKKESSTRQFIEDMRKKATKLQDKDQVQIFVGEERVEIDTQQAIEQSLASQNQNQMEIEDENSKQQEQKSENQQKMQIEQTENIEKVENLEKVEKEAENQKQQQEIQAQKSVQVEKKPEPAPIVDTQEERKKYKNYLDDKYIKLNIECNEKVEEYLKEGEQVYYLYSILNHSGGAMGGHYYAYIKSFEDGKWYCFNDSNVTMTDPDEMISKVFGGNSNSCAYMLFYKRIEQNKDDWSQWGGQFTEDELPEIIKNRLAEEKTKIKEMIDKGSNPADLQQISRPFTIKVYYKLEVKSFTFDNIIFAELQDAVFEHFQIKEKENGRLRVYQPHNDSFLEEFTGRENRTLGQLKLQGRNMGIEFKKPDETWSSFDENNMTFRYTFWAPDLKTVEEKQLQLYKIIVKKDDTVQQLMDAVKQVHNIDSELIVVRRVCDYGTLAVLDKPVEQYYENSIFYFEKYTTESLWIQEFDKEQHRIVIKFNTPNLKTEVKEGQPNDEFPNVCVIDDRANMYELKLAMCAQIGIDESKIIMRRGGRAGLELKDLEVEVGQNSFVKGSSIYLEYGTPIKANEFRCLISIAKSENLLEDRNLYVFEELGEYATPGDIPISQLIPPLVEWINQKTNRNYDANRVRLRERIADRLNKVYRDKTLKEQGVIEMRMISMEYLEVPYMLSNKELLILVRLWDQTTWNLSERHEFVIQKSDSGLDLARQLATVFPIDPTEMEVARIITIYRFNRFELLNENWISLNSEDIMLYSQPLHITNDGTMLILRHQKQMPRDLTEEEIKKYGIINTNYQKQKPTSNKPKYQPEEKALKIMVKRVDEKKVDEKKVDEKKVDEKQEDVKEDTQMQIKKDEELQDQKN